MAEAMINERARRSRVYCSVLLLALFILCPSAFTKPVFRAELDGGVEIVSYNDSAEKLLASSLGARASINRQSPFSLLIRARYATISNDSSSEVLISPELAFQFSRSISLRWSLFARTGGGYRISSIEKSEIDRAYLFAEAGLEFTPVPTIGLSVFGRVIPLKSPMGSEDRFVSFGGGIGISYLFGFEDEDGDWIPDENDTCPGTPKRAKVDRFGCALDTDGDGVFDGLDKCPGTPFEALVESTGCPSDADGDGVYDGVDRCDDTPDDIEVDSTGCPKDSDADGVPDYIDTCAATPKGAIVDELGCPSDSDEDGVMDGIDQCPKTPSGFVVNQLGCPFVEPVEDETIYDAYDAGLNLRSGAMQRLDNIAERLRAYPYRVVEIGVYTDSEGSATYNINRSYRVAEKVRDVLVARGVMADQLKLKGYGEANPVASNATPEGRNRNRRIIFRCINGK